MARQCLMPQATAKFGVEPQPRVRLPEGQCLVHQATAMLAVEP